ncbi:MAG: EamA family transporter [Deltaproteobacteria bacterium]|nr:EamA family transporter [Deltaproteobacteria bacterium]
MGSEALALICGLAAAASFGTGDFCGGFATKRSSVFRVIVISQIFGLALIAGLAVALKEPIPSGGNLVFGGLAGLFGTGGLTALYIGLARGRMGIVAPVSTVVGATLPITIGMFLEGAPSVGQILGLLLGLCAIWFLAGGGGAASVHPHELGLPILAGVGFGFFFIFIDQVSETAIFWPLVMARIVSITMISAFIMTRRRKIATPWKGQLLIIILLAGAFDAAGNVLFALASSLGRLDISTTLTSLYPAGTVFLAWLILRERLASRQWFGLAVALAALVLIAS